MLFNNIIIIQVKYITMETREVGRIEYNGFLFPHSYSDEGVGTTHLDLHLRTHAEKRNPLFPIRAASFVSIDCTVLISYA
jgi:hypothetical protein